MRDSNYTMSSSSTDTLAAFLFDEKDGASVVSYVREKWPKSLSTYISAIKRQWMTIGEHHEDYPRHYAEAAASVDAMIKEASGAEKAALLAGKTMLEEFNHKSLTDKNAIQRRIRTMPYSGEARVDDIISNIVIFPAYIDDLRVTTAERVQQQKKATAALEARSVESITVKGSELITKCRAILRDTRANPFDTAAALSLVSGRRMCEIFKTAILTPVGEDNRMRFQGQVKKSAFDANEAYDIPVLAAPDLIVKALARLRASKDCASLSNRECNLKWSNSANVAAKRLLPDAKFHTLRAVYSVLCFNCALPHKFSLNAFVKSVLGHQSLSNSINYTWIHITDLKKQHKFIWKEAM